MNICIIGDGLSSLSLAKSLINKKINVHVYQKMIINKLSTNRTIGLSKNNLKFFEKEIQVFSKKKIWEIKKIEIYSENLKNGKILNFEKNKSNLFYMIKNDYFYQLLNNKLLKNKYFKKITIKEDNFYEKLLKDKKYDLIINCDSSNFLSKKYFSKTINKNYNSNAYTTILEHERLENNIATQIFTKFGPIAYLPISNTKTSVVCSLENQNIEFKEDEVLGLINKNNLKYKIKKIFKLNKFKLQSSNLRNYFNKDILAFGDLLHRVHPLAGQGFNMTVRDIKILSEIIQDKIDLGLQLDQLIFEEFEKKTKHINLIFSGGIDFIYEFFNFDKKNRIESLNKVLKFLGKNKRLSNALIKVADRGFSI